MDTPNLNTATEPLAVPGYNIEDRNGHHQTVTRLKEKLLPRTRIILLIWLAIYIGLLGVGAYGIKKCPVENYIPMYLIAAGAIGIVSKILNVNKENIRPYMDISPILTCLYGVQLVLFIFGSYWVFKEYKPSYDPKESKEYCNKTVYLVAFVYICFVYAITAMVITGFVCFLGCIYFVKSTEPVVDPEAAREP